MSEKLDKIIEKKAEAEPGYAIAYALLQLAQAQQATATQLKFLGNGDASTKMGAIEGLSKNIGDKLDTLSSAISGLREE